MIKVYKLNKFDKQLYDSCMKHLDDPNTKYILIALEEKQKEKHKDLKLVGKAFELMGEKNENRNTSDS
jgi:hypothetical protein